MRNRAGLLAALLHAGLTAVVTGQGIGATPSCGKCRVVISPTTVLSPGEESEGFGPLIDIAMDRRSIYYIASSTFPGQINVFNGAGKFVQTIGRKGPGPGEFTSRLLLFVDAADSLHVVEAATGRYAVFDGTWKLARTSVLSARRVSDFIVLSGGRLFASAPQIQGQKAKPLQLLNGEGRSEKVFGPTEDLTDFLGMSRHLLTGNDGTVWSLSSRRYTLENWSPNGDLLRSLRGSRTWISELPTPRRLNTSQERPHAQFAGLLRDNEDRIFVFVMTADAEWKPRQPDDVTLNNVWDTIIEVLDAKSGALLTQQRYDRVLLPVGEQIIYTMIEDDVGERVVQLMTLKMAK